MALRQEPTLAEMVADVLDDLNLGEQSPATHELDRLIRRKLRVAQGYLWTRYRWLANRITKQITLTKDVGTYDIPDNFEPGSFTRVYAQSTKASSTLQWTLENGIDPQDRTADGKVSTHPYNPYKYEIQDGVLKVHPVPRDPVPLLFIEMDVGPVALTGDDERPSVDGRACVMLASILVKEQRRMPVGNEERAIFEDYVDACKNRQRKTVVFQMGTDYVHPDETKRFDLRRNPYPSRDYWKP